MASTYPFNWAPAPEALENERSQHYTKPSGLINAVVSDPLKVHMPRPMVDKNVGERVYNFKLRPDDVWIITYPKCGTTWSQEMVWQIVNKVNLDMAKIPLLVRSPFLEMEALISQKEVDMMDEKAKQMYQSLALAENLPTNTPRVIKSHLPLEMLPPKLLDTCKVIFVCRNPKDCCVSYYHHSINMPGYNFDGDFDFFAKSFIEGNAEYGSYWTMLKSAWKHKNHPNMKILWFEDMKRDLISVIGETAQFLGIHLTQLQILKLDDHLYIDNFKKIVTESFPKDPGSEESYMVKFFRKGVVGDWKNYFKGENLKVWDQWIQDNLQDTDIILPDHK